MSDDEIEIEKPDKMVDIVEKKFLILIGKTKKKKKET